MLPYYNLIGRLVSYSKFPPFDLSICLFALLVAEEDFRNGNTDELLSARDDAEALLEAARGVPHNEAHPDRAYRAAAAAAARGDEAHEAGHREGIEGVDRG